MKSKIDKYLKYVAAAVFVATLAINVVITLDDPFVLLSDEAIATTTNGGSSSNEPDFYRLKEIRLRSVSKVTGWELGAKLNGNIPFVGQLVNKILDSIEGEIYYSSDGDIDQYTVLCPATTVMQTVECISQDWTNCPSSGCPQSSI